jgi:hypothetical protein
MLFDFSVSVLVIKSDGNSEGAADEGPAEGKADDGNSDICSDDDSDMTREGATDDRPDRL